MTTTTREQAEPTTGLGPSAEYRPPRRRRSLAGYLFMPVLLALVLTILWLWLRNNDLSSQARQRLDLDYILTSAWQHLQLTFASTVLVLLIAIPLGVLLSRPAMRGATPSIIWVFNVGQGIPTIGLLALISLVWDVGFWPVVAGLVAYCILAVLRNTMVGLEQVDAAVIESARGMGMTKLAVLLRIEMPLAVPVIMAGVRTALVINVGTATLGTLFAAGGLGNIINTGISRSDQLIVVAGSVLTAVLALLVDYVAGIAEDFVRPHGL